MKLNGKAFALSCGILSGIGLFLVTWWKILFQGVTSNPTWVGKVFKGYSISPLGSVIGLVWAFVIGLVGGTIFAWLYNRLASGDSSKKEE
jgi:hypothetical protein